MTERVAFQAEREGGGVLTSEEAVSSGNIQIIGAIAGAGVLSGCGGGTETTSAPAPVAVSISEAQASRFLAQATIGYIGCQVHGRWAVVEHAVRHDPATDVLGLPDCRRF